MIWRQRTNAEPMELYGVANGVTFIKVSRLRWTGRVARCPKTKCQEKYSRKKSMENDQGSGEKIA